MFPTPVKGYSWSASLFNPFTINRGWLLGIDIVSRS
jgi:hypothetical protein